MTTASKAEPWHEIPPNWSCAAILDTGWCQCSSAHPERGAGVIRPNASERRRTTNPALLSRSRWRGSTGIDGQPEADLGPSRPGSMPRATAGAAGLGPCESYRDSSCEIVSSATESVVSGRPSCRRFDGDGDDGIRGQCLGGIVRGVESSVADRATELNEICTTEFGLGGVERVVTRVAH